jgi:hypothetical protein
MDVKVKTVTCADCGWTVSLDAPEIARWTVADDRDYCDICSAKRAAKKKKRKVA